MSRLDHGPKNWPARLTSTRTKAPVSRQRVFDSKNRRRRVCFSKTQATRTWLELYKKSNQIRQYQARSGQILAIFSEICRFRQKNVDSGKRMQISTTFLQIPAIDRHSPSPETDLTNWCQRSISGSFTLYLTSTGRVQIGSKIDLWTGLGISLKIIFKNFYGEKKSNWIFSWQLFIFFIKLISKLLKNDLLINVLKAPVNMTHLLVTNRIARLDIVFAKMAWLRSK